MSLFVFSFFLFFWPVGMHRSLGKMKKTSTSDGEHERGRRESNMEAKRDSIGASSFPFAGPPQNSKPRNPAKQNTQHPTTAR